MEATTFLTRHKTQILDMLTGNIHYAVLCAFEEKLLVNFEYTNLKAIPRPADAAAVLVEKILYRGETVCKTFLRLLQDSRLTDVFPGLRTLPWHSPVTTTAATPPPTAPSATHASRPAVSQLAQISSQQPPSISTPSACSISTRPAAPAGAPAKHFVDHHRPALIQRVSVVEPILDILLQEDVLSSEGYSTVRSKNTRADKMRELYKLLSCGGPQAKDIFYRALQENERYLLEDLRENDPSGPRGDEGACGRRETPSAQPRVAAASVPAAAAPAFARARDHFVDRNRTRLVNEVKTVDHILDLVLNERVVSGEAYNTVRATSTPHEKMRKLHSFLNSTRAKDAFCRALETTDPVLYRELNR